MAKKVKNHDHNALLESLGQEALFRINKARNTCVLSWSSIQMAFSQLKFKRKNWFMGTYRQHFPFVMLLYVVNCMYNMGFISENECLCYRTSLWTIYNGIVIVQLEL